MVALRVTAETGAGSCVTMETPVRAGNNTGGQNRRNHTRQMISSIKDKKVKEFGDFQTPKDLAFEVCRLVSQLIGPQSTIVEPTCGLGNFVHAASKFFSSSEIIGFELSDEYSDFAQHRFGEFQNITIEQVNFFEKDWRTLFNRLAKPLLVLGNPPWVTNSQLGVLDSKNLPKKQNIQGLSGFDAMTGKSNFDISEWMLTEMMNALDRQDAYFAILCKTAVARKVLKYAWKSGIRLSKSAIYKIDTERYFNASVDACLFFCEFSTSTTNPKCSVYKSFEDDEPQEIGFENNEMLASIPFYDKWKYLNGGCEYKWRSGVKHDCSKVMEFTKVLFGYENSLGEIVDMEDDFIYPMLKSSDLANGKCEPRRWMLVTQTKMTDDTNQIAEIAPKTWDYLNSNAKLLDARGSSIYKKRVRFAVFGIGDYTFSPWKVAISGFYKRLEFRVVGSHEGKSIVLDDTCYFLPFQSEDDAKWICNLLNSTPAREFFESFIFWDAKRPISSEVLQKLNLRKLEKLFLDIEKLGDDEAYSILVNASKHDPSGIRIQNSFQFD